ncbi:MAG: GWxTD domain-containing protein [Acidobacteria bacterium]|nr:GWxTD domain-containing protein [Acidobacteriota bacterium]
MTILETFVRTPFAEALGRTLLHSLWEAAIAALSLAAVLAVVRSPRIRYLAACAALVSVLVGFCVTLVLCAPLATGPVATTRIHPVSRDGAPLLADPFGGGLRAADALPWLAPAWLAGVAAFWIRGAAGWAQARRLRQTGLCHAPADWRARLERLAASIGLTRAVELFESGLTQVPITIGYLRPVILLPAGILLQLPVSQLEAILLHELAHIQRRDYLVNLLQTAAEGLLFHHPAVWWISRVIRDEREHCADDVAAAAVGNVADYARALTSLEQLRQEGYDAALAATGGSLMKRIRRLIHTPEPSAASRRPLLGIALTFIAVLAGATLKMTAAPAGQATQQAVSPYEKWLKEDVAYIIEQRERIAFENLKTDPERDHFIEQFWLRRDPTPGTPENEFKAEHYRRIAYANQRFTSHSGLQGWRTDRGRTYILFGPPDEIESHPSGGGVLHGATGPAYPWEAWLYRYIKDMGRDVTVEYRDEDRNGEFRMTRDPHQ